MNKIISVIVLLSLLVLPIIALAQTGVKECCTLNKTIKLDTFECVEGTIPAPDLTAARVCDSAATDPGAGVPAAGDWCNIAEERWGMFCMLNSLYRVTDWVSYILFAFVGVMIIIGAFTIVTAAGAPDKVKSGKNYILYAVIGLVVAMFARAIPALVKAVVGM